MAKFTIKKNKFIIFFIIYSIVVNKNIYSKCPDITLQDLNKYLQTNSNITKIIFFSTWCIDCKTKIMHIMQEGWSKHKYLLINIFDTQERSESILQNMHIDLICFHAKDTDIVKAYHISTVPTEIMLKQEN